MCFLVAFLSIFRNWRENSFRICRVSLLLLGDSVVIRLAKLHVRRRPPFVVMRDARNSPIAVSCFVRTGVFEQSLGVCYDPGKLFSSISDTNR